MNENTGLRRSFSSDNFKTMEFWNRRTLMEKALLPLLIIVFIICLILCITFASYSKGKCKEGTPDQNKDICNTAECIKSNSYLLKSMNDSIDPCVDFFSFACGGYLKNTFLIGNKVGRFTKLSANIMLRMKELLEETVKDADPEHWSKTKTFYGACMNIALRQNLSSEPLEADLKKMGGWPLLNQDWEKGGTFDGKVMLKELLANGFNKDILLKIDIDLDLKNTSNTLITVDQPVLGMAKILYLLETPHDYAVKAYKRFILKCAMLINKNINVSDAITQIDEAVDIEIKLAKASIAPDERKKFYNLYDNTCMYTYSELQNKYKSIPWKDLIESLLPDSMSLKEEDTIWIPVPSAINEIENILKNQTAAGKRALANYLMYRSVLMASQDLSYEFARSLYNFYNVLTGNPYTYPAPWQACVEVTGHYFYYSISSIYATRYFQSETKNGVSVFESNVKEELKSEIRKAQWIDDDTKKEALLKAEEMRAVIGYPEEILNDTILNDFYEKVEVNENHYKNKRSVFKFYAMREMDGLHEPYDKHRWDITENLLLANAFYSPIKNSITIPVGVLQEETYNINKPNYLNYGSLGMLIGHELTHGFDMIGSQFDAQGDWKFWWDNITYSELEKRSQCFVDQYNGYEVPGMNKTVNGSSTVNENMADTGGVYAAYQAYQNWVKKNGAEKRLPGLKYTPNQLFWVSFASVWCSRETPEYLLHSLMFEEHSPPQYRVRGVVSNLKEFSTDFGCAKDAPMNPDNKCSLWN